MRAFRSALIILVPLFGLLAGCGPKVPSGIRDLALQGNILWACGDGQVYHINLSDHSFEGFSFPCDHILVARNGWVWAYWSYRVMAYDGKDWHEFTDVLQWDGVASGINFLSETSDGTIWVSSRELSRYDPRTNHSEIVIPSPPIPTPTPGPPPPPFSVVSGPPGYIGPVFEAADGALWFNEHAQGIVRWTQDSKQVWEKDNGLSNPIPTVIMQAHDGSIWVGTLDGVNRFRDGVWQSWKFPGPSYEDGEVLAMLEDKHGRVWVSFESGLMVWHWDRSTWSEIGDFTIGYRKGEAKSLFQASSGEIWICCHIDGVVKYDNGSLIDYPIHIVTFLETPDHRLFGGGSSLFLYNRQLDQWQPFPGK